MTLKQILSVIKKQLSFFNNEGIEIDDKTVTSTVLDSDEMMQQKLFKGNVLWTLWNAKHKDGKNKFPSNWLSMTAEELANKLLILFLFMTLTTAASAQMRLNLSAAKTERKSNAINIAFSYLRSLDSIYSNQDYMVYGKKSYIIVTPDVEFITGTEDAFSSIIAKATALAVKFRTTTVDGIETPDADKVLHVFPISIGAETNNKFNFINGLLELGYQPYYQSPTSNTPNFVKHTKFGIYLQGGYKFKLGSSSTLPIGGQIDESAEQIKTALFRAKTTFSIQSDKVLEINGFRLGLIGNTALWYDFVNTKTYYRVQGIARIFLTPTMFFDLDYAKGSGAPNFNTGDQYSTGLTIIF